MTDSSNDYPVRLVAKDQSFKRSLRTSDEAREFLDGETAFWTSLTPTWANLQSPIPELLNALTLQRVQHAQAELKNPVVLADALRGMVYSEGTYGRNISELAKSDPAAVPGATLVLSAREPPDVFVNLSNQFAAQRVHFSAFTTLIVALGKLQIAERSNRAEREQLRDLVVEVQALRDDIDSIKVSEQQSLKDQINAASEQVEQTKAALAETLVHANLSLSGLLKNSELTIHDLEEKTKNRIILEAPTTYWSDKAKSHRTTAIIFGLIFLAALAVGTYWLTHHGVTLVADAHKQIVGDRQEAGLLALVPLAFITLPTLAFAWLLRHVSRIIVQNISLGADARLRGTIATTYSALTHDRPANPAELAIALQALFRPIDGSAHSEIAPPNIQEIMEMATGKARN